MGGIIQSVNRIAGDVVIASGSLAVDADKVIRIGNQTLLYMSGGECTFGPTVGIAGIKAGYASPLRFYADGAVLFDVRGSILGAKGEGAYFAGDTWPLRSGHQVAGAFARLEIVAGVPTLRDSYGIASVTDLGVGIYQVDLDVTLSLYAAPIASADGQAINASAQMSSLTRCIVRITDSAGAFVDSSAALAIFRSS